MAFGPGRLKSAPRFEHRVVAPRPYLRWLIGNGERLDRVRLARAKLSAKTLQKRQALFGGDESVKNEAFALLEKSRSLRQGPDRWYILEGETVVDCVLEFENVTIFVEGKRTEPNLTSATSWYRERKQVIRNLDCLYHAPERTLNWYVLLVVEEGTRPAEEAKELDKTAIERVARSLPHLGAEGAAALWQHYLGFTTWQELQVRFRLADYPDTTEA